MAGKGKHRARAQATPSLKPFYIIIGIVAVIGVGAILATMRGGMSAAAVAPVDLSGIDNPQELVAKARGVSYGQPGAPVQVIVFNDYMCPWCATFAMGSEKQIKSQYVEAGQAEFVYYDFPLGGSHVHSFLAARAARCAEDQDRFWDYHDVLLGRQSSWMYERAAPITHFTGYAEELGLDVGEFRRCLNSDRHAELVTANSVLGAQLGVSGTPTVFVNGRRVANPINWSEMQAAIEQHIGS